jgi:hypothetical protein
MMQSISRTPRMVPSLVTPTKTCGNSRIATKYLVGHVAEQSREIERERARRYALARESVRLVEGHRPEEGTDSGGRRDFLAGRAVHAGQMLYLLTYAGWHAVRYESNTPHEGNGHG